MNVFEEHDLALLEAQGTAQNILKAARNERRSFPLTHVRNLLKAPPSVDWLVKKYIEQDTLAQIFGDPGAGKSFVAIDLACCVATGKEWHGHRTLQSPVVYIAGEGRSGLGKRFLAWQIRHHTSLEGVPLVVSEIPAALFDPENAVHVADAIEEMSEEVPGLVVVDTLARNFGAGGNENDTHDMGAFIQNLDIHLRGRFRCCVLVVHHTGHKEKERARGSMALKAALDHEYRLTKEQGGLVSMSCSKMKEHEEPPDLHFKFAAVETPWTDADGDPITSAVLDLFDGPIITEASAKPRGRNQSLALRVLRERHKRQRATLEEGGRDPAAARVLVVDWRQDCLDAGMNSNRFNEVKQSMTERGILEFSANYVTEVATEIPTEI